MKIMIASDIHGSAYWCKKMLECFEAEKADRLFLLGDLLYHGPRNDLPKEYDPKKVCEMLNGYKNKILCVRGNCDSEVDQMIIDFPIMADYALLVEEGKTFFMTHGHIFNNEKLPPLKEGDFLVNGHTHIPAFDKKEGYTYVNPGSVSIPKENSKNGYIVLENGRFIFKTLEGEVYREEIC